MRRHVHCALSTVHCPLPPAILPSQSRRPLQWVPLVSLLRPWFSTEDRMSSIAPAPASSLNLDAQPLLVRRAAVLGAGTMGSRIAAHLANAGVPVLLLDMVPEGASPKSKLAIAGLEALAKSKPAAFYDPAYGARITPGNFDDDLPKLADCDWVIE